MMLVQKPQLINLASPAAYAHRRHPSAPVVVQPTRIPGLLSLSKPPRPSPQRQQPQRQQNQPRPAPKNPKPVQVVRAQALTPAAEIAAPATPSPRGRSQAKKDKRSVSPPTVPPQAEAPISFDPFLDSSPSGKLAQRRQQSTKAIPVPSTARPKFQNISRSDPLPSHIQRPRPLPKRASTIPDFPVCDDMSEYDPAPPLTPRRLYDTGPQTAPLSARTPGAFPWADFAMPAPPSPQRSTKKHRRTPSEGVFHMSSDEEVSSGPGGIVLNPSVKALFGLASTTPVPVSKTLPSTPSPSRNLAPRSREPSPSGLASVGEANEKAGFFASSMFQNSPSPDELPDPLLL